MEFSNFQLARNGFLTLREEVISIPRSQSLPTFGIPSGERIVAKESEKKMLGSTWLHSFWDKILLIY